jgi:hypothetical protein
MQVPIIILAIAIEVYVVLLVAAVALFFFSRKQKKLLRRQQEKLLEFIDELKSVEAAPAPLAEKSYRQHINEQIEITRAHFDKISPTGDISTCLEDGEEAADRVIALRYAFLRSEELSTTETQDSEPYWSIFLQTLEPLLPRGAGDSDSANDELETYKKRVENLEKFKKLFFDLEKKWNEAQTQAQISFDELSSYASKVNDTDHYMELLNSYHGAYAGINDQMSAASLSLLGRPQEHKTINITRQDPRAAEEIMNLRNVAADQHRVISNLQKQLQNASTAEEKVAMIEQLEQQLQRQIRFVQESDTCVQLLEEELNRAHEQLTEQQQQLLEGQQLGEENDRIKETLHSFSLESKDLLGNLEELENENSQLKDTLEQSPAAPDKDSAAPEGATRLQSELVDLKKQYAELEEKYLELKFK